MTQQQSIHVDPVPGALGAEISGIDLRAPIGSDLVKALHSAFLANHVLFFRDQELDPETHAKVGSLFGELEDYPFVEALPGHPKVIPVIKEPDETGNFGGGWHTDLIYRPQPSMATMLYAVEVPTRGGDTLFADGGLALRELSTRMQDLLATLRVEYSVRHLAHTMTQRGNGTSTGNRSMPSRSNKEVLDASPVHPLVRTHPETGERALYFSREHTINFEGMTPRESRPLLDWLESHMTQPDFTTRFHWRKGSVAFWDNRCVSHRALNDYQGERRHMHRLTIAGDIPR